MTRFAAVGSGVAGTLAAAAATLLLVFGVMPGSPRHATVAPERVVARALPLAFEPNAGRTDTRVRFMARGAGYSLFLTPSESVIAVSGRGGGVVRTRLTGARLPAEPRGAGKLPGVVNWLVGPKRNWRTHIPTYGRVVYRSVYRAVDLVYHGHDGALEYDFVVRPGADPSQVGLAISGPRSLRVDRRGDLLLRLPGGTVRQERPIAYQLVGGERRPVDARYRIDGGRVRFELGRYDRGRSLVIDPVLNWKTWLGATGSDTPTDIAVEPGASSDLPGAVYLVGRSNANSFPVTAGALRTATAADTGETGEDWVTKLGPDGSRIFSTYFGGAAQDEPRSVAVDATGAAYIVGTTVSTGEATAATMQTTNAGGGGDAFVAKLDPSGTSFGYFTYLGGTGYDEANQLQVDSAGRAYVVGTTASTNFPTTTGPANPSFDDAFLTELKADGSGAIFSRYVDSSGRDEDGTSLDVDSAGKIYVAGTASTHLSGVYHPFFFKFAAGGATQLFTTTTFAGDGSEKNVHIAAAEGEPWSYATHDQAWLAVSTASTNLDGGGESNSGANDIFVARLTATGAIDPGAHAGDGTAYFGTSAQDQLEDLDTDAQGNAYLVGTSQGSGFPERNTAQNFAGGGGDAVALKVSYVSSYVHAVWSTYAGGNSLDYGAAIATAGIGAPWIAGYANAETLPAMSSAAAQPSHSGGDQDAWLGQIVPPGVTITSRPAAGTTSTTASFSFTAAVAEQNTEFRCRLDGGAVQRPCVSPKSYSGLPDGQHTFVVTQYDEAETPGGSVSYPWIVDTSPPAAFDLVDPADGAGGQPTQPAFSWNAATDLGGIEKYQLYVDDAVDQDVPSSACSAATCAATASKALAEGLHTWKIVAIDTLGHSRPSSQRSFTVAPKPTAGLTIAPNPVLAGRLVTFQATSGLEGSPVAPSFEWDLDGDGIYETSTGSTPTTTKSYATPGAVTVGVKVSTTGGSSIATGVLTVSKLGATGTQLGVSINHGAQYTRTPKVKVTATFPAGTTSMLFANDGGFFDATTFQPASLVDWTLDSSGPERLPKTIYVRFLFGTIPSETHQDDIILDETPPTVSAATVAPASASSTSSARAARLRTWLLKVRAKDTNSGLRGIQVTASKRKPGRLLTYKAKKKVKLAKRPRFVRAKDRAGNYSRWRKLH